MAKRPGARIHEKDLTKGQLRKLNALRKSLGKDIADKAFAEWLSEVGTEREVLVDKNAQLIAESIMQLIKTKKLKFPRGGYHVTRWRDQVIVKPAAAKK